MSKRRNFLFYVLRARIQHCSRCLISEQLSKAVKIIMVKIPSLLSSRLMDNAAVVIFLGYHTVCPSLGDLIVNLVRRVPPKGGHH